MGEDWIIFRFEINSRGWFFLKRFFKNFNRKPYYHEKKFHQEKDLYFSFHYVLKKKRRKFLFYISLYYTEVLIYRHTWPCIVNCYWSAEKQHKGSANRKKNKVCRCTGKYRLPFLITTFPPPHTPHYLAPSLLLGNSVLVVQL